MTARRRPNAKPVQHYSTPEVGRLLQVSDDTVRALIDSGDLAAVNVAVKPGDLRWRVPETAVAAFLERRRYQPASRRRAVGAAS